MNRGMKMDQKCLGNKVLQNPRSLLLSENMSALNKSFKKVPKIKVNGHYFCNKNLLLL